MPSTGTNLLLCIGRRECDPSWDVSRGELRQAKRVRPIMSHVWSAWAWPGARLSTGPAVPVHSPRREGCELGKRSTGGSQPRAGVGAVSDAGMPPTPLT